MKNVSVKHLMSEFEYDYYMYLPLTIILQSCLGSLAAMLILSDGTTLLNGIELTICVSLAMGYNAALLTHANVKFTFWLLAASLLVNTFFVVFHLF